MSAMGGTTDQLLAQAQGITAAPLPRELDALLATGEQVSNALTAMALHDLGAEARSLTGWQAGILTSRDHGSADIIDVCPHRVRDALDHGVIPLVAGFQGLEPGDADVTTLGRGGSDTTAVALAAALKADACEIYTDVAGVYTADPKVVPEARPLACLTHQHMREMAASGAKVLALPSVEYARRHGVTLHVRSSYDDTPGTVVSDTFFEAANPQQGPLRHRRDPQPSQRQGRSARPSRTGTGNPERPQTRLGFRPAADAALVCLAHRIRGLLP
jgi:aspartate kinase